MIHTIQELFGQTLRGPRRINRRRHRKVFAKSATGGRSDSAGPSGRIPVIDVRSCTKLVGWEPKSIVAKRRQ